VKKLSYEQKWYQLIRAKKLEKRRLRTRTKTHHQRNARKIPYGGEVRLDEVKIAPPKVLSLEENYESVVSFIQRFRDIALDQEKNIYVDFRPIQKIHSNATLVLAAELDRWRRFRHVRLMARDINEWNPEVRRLLNEMGMFHLLNTKNSPRATRESETANLNYIKFQTHNLADGVRAKLLRIALERYAGKIAPKQTQLLFGGLTEAMTNVIQHAYPEGGLFINKPIKNQWWMAGSVNRSQKRLTVTFFDQGVGIPVTLPSKYTIERINEFLGVFGLLDTDASRIKAAMELGRTSTNKENRGRGLQNIKEFVDASQEGQLRIISGRGEYVYNSNGSDTLINRDHNIGGTLIQWTVYF
jgi:hypothetical protein